MSFEINSIGEYESVTESKGVTVIHFWAEWNNYDTILKKILKELAIEFEEKVKFCSLNIDKEQFGDFLRSLPLLNIPTLAYFKNGNKIAFEVGLRKKEELQDKIKQIIES